MAVYAYLRVSTDKQDGINQKRGVDALAVARRLTIDEYIDDEGKSGTLEPEKRELGKLLKKLKAGDILLAGEISRLGRSLFMIFRILEYCLNNGITIMTAKDGYTLGNDIQSKVMAFAFGLSAEIERDMISRRTKEALAIRKENGVNIGRYTGSRTKIRKVDIQKAKELIAQGYKKVEVARILGVNRTTLYRALAPLPPQYKKILDSHKEELRDFCLNGKGSLDDFGKKYGIPCGVVCRYNRDFFEEVEKIQREKSDSNREKAGLRKKNNDGL